MVVNISKIQYSSNAREDYGKCLCVSFPGHELELIKDLDTLSHLEFCSSRSQYIRLLIRREKLKLKEQMRNEDGRKIYGRDL